VPYQVKDYQLFFGECINLFNINHINKLNDNLTIM